MGAWGYKAFDNDTALDWSYAVLDDSFWRKIKTALESKSHHTARAAACMVSSIMSGCRAVQCYDFDARQLAIDALTRIASDREWLNTWDEPDAVLCEIEKEIRQLAGTPTGTSLGENLSQLV